MDLDHRGCRAAKLSYGIVLGRPLSNEALLGSPVLPGFSDCASNGLVAALVTGTDLDSSKRDLSL